MADLNAEFQKLISAGRATLRDLEERYHDRFNNIEMAQERRLGEIREKFVEEIGSINERFRTDVGDIRELHRREILAIRESYQSKIESEIKKMRAQTVSTMVSACAAAAIIFVVFLYTGTEGAHSGMREINQSIISLQDSLLRAQSTIKTTMSELEAAQAAAQQTIRNVTGELEAAKAMAEQTMKRATGELEAARTLAEQTMNASAAALRSATEDIANGKAELNAARERLDETRKIYDERVRELQGTAQRRAL